MTASDNHALVGRALNILSAPLQVYVERVLTPLRDPWVDILRDKDTASNREYSPTDPQLMLRAINERLGNLGFPFNASLSRAGRAYAAELQVIRNSWAHNATFDTLKTARALQTAELLAREIGAGTQAEEIAALQHAIEVAPAGTKPADVAETAVPVPPVSDKGPTTIPTPVVTSEHASRPVPGPRPGPRQVPGSRPAPESTPPAPQVRVPAAITLTTKPVLSFALMHCKVPVVDQVAIVHPQAQTGATLQVSVRAGGVVLSEPYLQHVELEAGRALVIEPDLRLDAGKMLGRDEQQPGIIEVLLQDRGGAELGRARADVDVLATSHWVDRPTQLGLELLAAHVQPNAASVQRLLREAGDLLAARTGSSALDPAADDSERIDAVAQAVYDAMAARAIHYAPPPASWGAGQKIRTPHEVLDGGLGTCLDTTVTLAAALEQAGLAPQVWLLKHHAFAGYWRTTPAGSRAATKDVQALVNQADLGQVRLVETTLLTGSTASFAQACRAAARTVEGDLDDVLGVLDVRQARRAAILPLPSRLGEADPHSEPARPHHLVRPAPVRPAPTPSGAIPRALGPARVEAWKTELLDLTAGSALIDPPVDSTCRLEVPAPGLDHLVGELLAGRALRVVPGDELGALDGARNVRHARDLPEELRLSAMRERSTIYASAGVEQFSATLTRLRARARTIAQESGTHGLYMSVGRLRWRQEDRDLSSPVWMVPVQLQVGPGQVASLRLADDGAPQVNASLLEKLRATYRVVVPALEGATPARPGPALAGLRAALADAGLPFRVQDRVDVACLGFAKLAMWADLDTHLDQLERNPLVHHLVHSPLATFHDPAPLSAPVDLDWLSTTVPLPADGSQISAVAQALAGRTFVLQGPPGTGKSQTITNIVSRAIGSGLKVLVVAKKQVALDVVHEHLTSLGLAPLCLDLRGPHTGPVDVHRKVATALELATHGRSTVPAQLEDDRRQLRAYAAEVHNPNVAGYTLHTAFNHSPAGAVDAATSLDPAALAAMTSAQVDQLREAAAAIAVAGAGARPRANHPWGWFTTIPLQFDVPAGLKVARQFEAALCAVAEAGVQVDDLEVITGPDDLSKWVHVAGAVRYPLADLDALRTTSAARVHALRNVLGDLAQDSSPWRQVLTTHAAELDVPTLHAKVLQAARGPLRHLKVNADALKDAFGPTVLPGAQDLSPAQAAEVTASLLATHQQVQAVRSMLAALPVALPTAGLNPADPVAAAALREEVSAAYRTAVALAGPAGARLRALYIRTRAGAGAGQLSELAQAWRDLQRTFAVTCTTGFLTTWSASAPERRVASAAQLSAWVRFVQVTAPLAGLGLNRLREQLLSGDVDPSTAVDELESAFAHASLRERLTRTSLGSFDPGVQHATISRFATGLEQHRAQVPDQIVTAAAAARHFGPDDLGALRRAAARRGATSLRSLLAEHARTIVKVLPCVLASPQDVARYLPAQAELFDVVLFDEASQIPVAEAIGALGRATSAVIAGDPAQMPPSRFMQSTQHLPEEDAVQDEESILEECLMAGVPHLDLSWHYRSTHESLIAFSNAKYYAGKLHTFPAPRTPQTDHVGAGGVHLVQVPGTFERAGSRTNPVEAAAVVADVLQRFATAPQVMPSVGVITFNRPQADLIEHLLRTSADERVLRSLEDHAGLFVKNLENVQGDEREVILLSVGYSANQTGTVPLTMGPLSAAGGERRLNVAITRARTQMVIYVSFDPQQLDVSGATHDGIRHLREYLELANDRTRPSGGPSMPAPGDRFTRELADALTARGHVARVNLGSSAFKVDLAVADRSRPDQELVAVLLDGPQWAARATAVDRDVLPGVVLRDLMGWPGVARVWLPEWINDPTGALDRIEVILQHARTR